MKLAWVMLEEVFNINHFVLFPLFLRTNRSTFLKRCILDIKKTAQAVNNSMFELISSKEEKERAFKYLDLDSVMKVLQQYLNQGPVDTKVAVLKWIHHLFTQAENEVHFNRFSRK